MLTKYLARVTRNLTLSHTIEPQLQHYQTFRIQQFQKYNQQASSLQLQGMYSQQGYQAFSKRHSSVFMKRLANGGLKISNIGIGTYKGSLNEEDDILQFNAIIDSVLSGINVIDTCSNFRGGRSERVVGGAVAYLIQQKNYLRNQLFLCSKAGYVRQSLPNQLTSEVINQHCIHPAYLEMSLVTSLQKLRIKTLDVFYLNNCSESQLQQIGRKKFEQRLHRAFQYCQKVRAEKKINYYGLSSWQAFRVPENNPAYLNLKNVEKIAQNVGGKNHGFRFLQVPINIMMPQAFAQKNQDSSSLLEAAESLKINVISNSPLLSGTLVNVPLPSDKLGCRHNGAKHLQMIRSIPSPALVSCLVGQKANRHLKKNVQVLNVPLLTESEWFNIFVPQDQPNKVSA